MAQALLACAQSCDLYSADAADCLAKACAFACNQVIGRPDSDEWYRRRWDRMSDCRLGLSDPIIKCTGFHYVKYGFLY
jgi:hypothetical protein